MQWKVSLIWPMYEVVAGNIKWLGCAMTVQITCLPSDCITYTAWYAAAAIQGLEQLTGLIEC
jgi:hypothetical protein